MAPPKFTAAAQFLGYSVQVNRFLHRLLEAKQGDVVTLEVVGDVAVHSDDGDSVIEETKTKTTGVNPVSDRSEDLWKTFRNWIQLVESESIDVVTTQFVLHANGDFTGNLVAAFDSASSHDEVLKAIVLAESELLTSGNPISKALKPLVEYVFSPECRSMFQEVVLRFSQQSGTSLSWDEMMNVLLHKAVPPDVADAVLINLLGWVKNEIDGRIAALQPAVLAQERFNTELIAILRRVDWGSFIAGFAPPPTEEEIENERGRTLVSQLEIVEHLEEDVLRSISDFLRARTDRIEWAERGTIHGSSFDELEDDLQHAWSNYKTRINVQAKAASPVEKGQLLLAECNLHSASLQGQTPPQYFLRGCYQALSDAKTLGWHPQYEELLDHGMNEV